MNKITLSILGVVFLSFNAFAQNADSVPPENPRATLTRSSDDNELQTRLSKNIYRTEYREEWHSHPHHGDHHTGHDASTWYENYQEQERYCHEYQDVEYYWDWEYFYEYVPYQEKVCHNETIYEEGPNVCREVEVIEDGVKKIRKICERQQIPRVVEHCELVWKTRPVLSKRMVQKSRLVTKCDWRYRTVTKTRLRTFEESHSHMVPVSVFDHQEEKTVTIVFPEDAKLEVGEVETYEVKFDGSKVSLNSDSKTYVYDELNREDFKNEIRITLKLGQLDKDEYGKSSIFSLMVAGEGDKAQLMFKDTKPLYKVKTTYRVELFGDNQEKLLESEIPLSEAKTDLGSRLFILSLVPGEGMLGQLLKDFIKGYVDYTVKLTVRRESVLFEGGSLEFTVTQSRQGDLEDYLFGQSSLSDFKLDRHGDDYSLTIKDAVAGHEKVRVTYEVKIWRKAFIGLGTHVVGRGRWVSDGAKEMVFHLKKGENNPVANGLREKLERGTTYYYELYVLRESPLFVGGHVAFDVKKKR